MKDQITLKTVSMAAKAFILIIVINYIANLIVK